MATVTSSMVRVRIARTLSALVMVPLSVLNGIGPGVLDERAMSNALLVLATRRDLRSDEGKHLARRLHTATWIAYLLGVRVLVDWEHDPLRLLDDRKSVIGELEAVDGNEGRYRCRMAGGTSAAFLLIRRTQRDERRASPYARG